MNVSWNISNFTEYGLTWSSFFSFIVCPRVRNIRVSTDILSCYVSVHPRVRNVVIFCENPLAYARYARDVTINDSRFRVVSPERVVGTYLGPRILAPTIFEYDIVHAIICLMCHNVIGYFRRNEYYFMYSCVDDLWRGRDNYLRDSDHDSDSGNDTETDVEYDDDGDISVRSADSGVFV